jgi:hypothetical protein
LIFALINFQANNPAVPNKLPTPNTVAVATLATFFYQGRLLFL